MRQQNGPTLAVGFAALLALSTPALADPRPQQTPPQTSYRVQPLDPLVAQLFGIERLEPKPLPLPRQRAAQPGRRITAR